MDDDSQVGTKIYEVNLVMSHLWWHLTCSLIQKSNQMKLLIVISILQMRNQS